ncbi:hypothetical protein [Legionella jordanis]|uniref:Neurogenic locus notch like protein n=1 Tax=Legionella jordanis TaxID=456 RepID=A0A0W0VGZ0_9GAMM|nr:hypothetical protein [Legionella jordanis]KTD18905.1 neurogenic locus notch like protein precursor [Legionella jordanis]RMX05530.1 neurogenic locus notch [Legionella jordanis]RMX19215.1 neurogenic locus notch [Legionella jordanis]VEH13005.1 neurogenic locus notch like protein precursor [Legionella jordanis]HAT8714048.1 neurogenic locus notch [Legionella jordanis]
MRLVSHLLIAIMLSVMTSASLAKTTYICDESTSYLPTCDKKNCCGSMGGINYCDSSAGRYVCNNGYYSSCYCTRHAIMDLQKLQGCCLWQGGVLTVDDATGAVVCNNGGISEACSLQAPPSGISVW